MTAARAFATLAAALILCGCAAAPPRQLRVCADPNNLPFSNRQQQGFENRIAEVVARELHAELRYTWWPQRRGFVRNTLKAGTCDLITGIPTTMDMVLATRPYYRSTYVFVWRRDRHLDITSFDDPRLGKLKIGVPVVGDDYANTPPAEALAKRGYVENLVGITVFGDYSKPNPPAALIDAVADGRVDVAVAWGPLAGYFARRENVPLELRPVSPQIELPFLPMVFDISMGVRRGDTTFYRQLNDILVKRKPEIDRILEEYGVPRVSERAGVAVR
ncbi:MAG TPA: substrate-binding domain-containing protein [Longimicrobiales bacterium]